MFLEDLLFCERKGRNLLKPEGLGISVSDLEYTLFHKYKMDYYHLKPRLDFFFFLFTGICCSSLLLGSGVSKPNAEDNPKSGRLKLCLFSVLFKMLLPCFQPVRSAYLNTSLFVYFLFHWQSVVPAY